MCAFFVVIVFLTLVQCTIKKPEAPTWRTNIVLPLSNKTWDMSELIEKLDQENLTTDSLGNPFFYYENVLDTVTINGSFTIDNVSQTIAESLGVIDLDPITGSDFQINLSDEFSVPPGDFPDTSFTISNSMPTIGDFSSVTVATGYTQLVIDNDFGLDLDTVIVTIIDDISSLPVTTYSIPGGIASGARSTTQIDLSGKTISNQLSVELQCHTPGAFSFSLADKSLSTAVSMPLGLSVSSATAKIPQISKSFSNTVDITSEHQLQSAVLDNGRLVLDIHNNTNLAAALTITLPDIFNGASPLVINQPISEGSYRQYTYDLQGYSLEPVDQIMPQSISIEVAAVVDSSGAELVTVDAGDDISVSASIENISFGEVAGIIATTTADFDNIEQDIDLPTGFEDIQLPSATITIEIENAVNIPGSFAVTVTGDQGQLKTISGTVSPGTPGNPVTTVITDSDLGDFMNPIPQSITVTGSATFGDGSTSGSITPNDYVIADFTLSSPLELIIGGNTFDGEWEDSELDIDSSVVDGLHQASFNAIITNHLPVGISAEILLSGDSATLYTNPEVVLGPITVTAGELNLDGTVSAATISENTLAMDSADLQVLYNDTLWVGELITLESTSGQAVRMTASDSFSISSYIEVDFDFSKDLWED